MAGWLSSHAHLALSTFLNYNTTMQNKHPLPPDTLNQLGVLNRREIEARILIPFIQALEAQYGTESIHQVLRDTIIQIAREQGAALSNQVGSTDLLTFSETLTAWTKDGALEIEILEQTPEHFSFDVTRCRYAEMYRALGIPELGAVLSCNRDYSLIEGFNPFVELTRAQTIMEGAPTCTFRYQLKTDQE